MFLYYVTKIVDLLCKTLLLQPRSSSSLRQHSCTFNQKVNKFQDQINISIFHPKVLLLSAGVTTSLFSDINFINDTLNELERI